MWWRIPGTRRGTGPSASPAATARLPGPHPRAVYASPVHLTNLTIKGFKSFASATSLHLEPGITCVVGPNGSGKSNVVDALSWVMGEQGAKTLRGGKMEDVIFAGTSSRPPLGRAEVALTIDNADGLLPIEYAEVTISRTLFRAGGSEYAINGEQCRLLDIQELLSDTGMGREMHVIVGQGRLDSVLQATPEDRRGFIEEAAGVLKHRRRKEKALRKLDAMAANLARVSDLTGEIRRQLGPLARQAAVARRAAVIQAEVRDARSRILADDLVQATALLEQDSADYSALVERQGAVEQRLAGLRDQLAAAESEAAAAAPELSRATDAWYALTSLRERFRSLGQVAGERVRHLGTPAAAPTGRDPDELERRAEEAAAAEAEVLAEVEAAKAVLGGAVEQRTAAEGAERDADSRLAALHRGVADRREGLARLTGQVGAKRSRLEALLAELDRLRADLGDAEARAAEAEREFVTLEQQAAGVEEGEEGLDEAHEQAVSDAEVARAALADLDTQEREALSAQQTAAATRDALELSLRRKDGTGALLDAAARAASGHGEDSAGADGASAGGDAPGEHALPPEAARGVLGALPDHLHVTPGFEDAIAAALGVLVDAALVTGPDAAVDAVRQVRDADVGHVRLVLADPDTASIADSGPDSGADPDAGPPPYDSPDLPAGAHAALDLVRVDDSDAAAPGTAAALTATLADLLRGVAVVDGLAEARAALAATDRETLRVCVTREGDVLGRTFASGGGPSTPSVLQLHAAHEEASGEHDAAAARVERARFARSGAESAVRDAEERVAATLADLHASDARLSAVAERLGRLGAVQRTATERLDRARPAIERAEAEIATVTAELEELTDRLEVARQEPATAEADLGGAQEARDGAADAARAARAAETEARLGLRTVEERAAALTGRAASLRAAAAQEREARRKAEEREARRARQATIAREVLAAVEVTVHALDSSVARAAEERDLAEAARTERDRFLTRVRGEVDEAATELAGLKDSAHREEVARAEQRLRVEHLRERAIEELGTDPDVLMEEYGPHQLIPDVTAVLEAEARRAEQAAARVAAQDAGDGAPEGAAVGDAPARPEPEWDDDTVEIPAGTPFVREDQEKRLVKAEKDLARLGRINPLALEEHAALEERHQFLTTQLADLQRSRQDLLGIVRDIDERVERVFREAYEDTAREFVGVFGRLFPGGEGRLVLTDPDDMLTTGIEVEARPAGKKVKRLSLLSGGERSLTAVALLVAIFKARPSPFYVMDEVEAALDDVNLGRLLEIFKELQEDSQLIVITHQKRTMEVADALYGITMRDGITQVISQRMERREDPVPVPAP